MIEVFGARRRLLVPGVEECVEVLVAGDTSRRRRKKGESGSSAMAQNQEEARTLRMDRQAG